MSDRLLRELGDVARSEAKAGEARFGDRWDHLAAGTLTAEEEAELEALAESSPEDRAAYEAFRPLGADFQARVVSAINAERAAEAPSPEPQEPRPRVLPFRRVMRRAEVWVGFAAAVAAGLFFVVRTPATEPISSGVVAELSGGSVASRGGETAQQRTYPPGSSFILGVSPKQPLTHPGKLKARAFLSTSAGREPLQSLGLENKFESAETGSVRLEAKMGEDIKVKTGDWIFWTVVARKSLPEAREVQQRLRANRPQDDSWQTLCDAVQKEETPPPAPSQISCVAFHAEGQPNP
ncbi:MAG TPA: hypothetical protein VF173_33175 [Thermoanaerobaculia bacterium]|nr:hypothetical protein [Thermoanaerobaculia bacterium]